MTSAERREGRYQRRKARRAEQKARRVGPCDSFDWVFTYEHLYHSYKMCRRGVAWKASVQKYITQAPLNILTTYNRLHNGTFKSSGFYEFDLMERGKLRHIKSVTIGERVVQRCLCDYALVPMISRTFIYDNGACMKDKGYTFAAERLTRHLRDYYKKHGNDGYVLLFDFSKFFDSVSHKLVKQIVREEFTDPRLIKLIDHFIDAFGDVGLGLGSQISQILALASANRLDHYLKERARAKYYARYNDDGYLIHHDKEYLEKCLKAIRILCKRLGITLNTKKTQIVKLSHGFTFLKIRYFLLPNGKIVKKLGHKSIVRMRRKMKKFQPKLWNGVMTCKDIYQSWQSWRAYAYNFDAYRTIRSMGKLYNKLFIWTPSPQYQT